MRLVLLLVPSLLCVAGCSQPAGQAQTAPLAAAPRRMGVTVAAVEEGDVSPQLTLVGAVVAARRSVLGSAVDGRVAEVWVDVGDPVSMKPLNGRTVGQPVAQLLTETISIEIAAAEADLELRRHELAELEAGTRDEELAQAAAAWQGAVAREKYAEDQFKRIEGLFEKAQSVSQQEFDEARSAALAAMQSRISARAAYDLARAGPREEQKDQARARLAAQAAEVRRLKDLRERYTIRSPFDGYVVAKHTEVGAWLSRGDPVAEVVELDPIDVEVQIPESLVSTIHLGDRIPLHVDALPAEQQVLEGRVDRIVPSADLRARTFPVRIRLDNTKTADGYLLKAGMLARVTIAGRPQPGLWIPQNAIVAERGVVFVAASGAEGPIAREVRIQRGGVRGELVAVRGNLRAGDQVVSPANEELRNGQRLEILVSD